ncbi:hypothetical protein DL98DRAFT_143111 [Cadophora sp. DSE1049]|nr:hypothetical protein DL98DRAFT_143111 [Cadophora sp. DSE1049]
MCVMNIYIDRYPNGQGVEYRQTAYCQNGQPGRPCHRLSIVENPVRAVQSGEPTTEQLEQIMNNARPAAAGDTFLDPRGQAVSGCGETSLSPEALTLETLPPGGDDSESERSEVSRNSGRPLSKKFSKIFSKSRGLTLPPKFPKSRGDTTQDIPRRDPLGLTITYTPKKGYKVDIIFVHGLGGSSRRTWSKSQDRDSFWPELFLPREPTLSEARISTFGYNSELNSISPSILSVHDFAKSLLFDLKYANGTDGEAAEYGSKPIVFIAHSLGGLIVKKAYILGSVDESFRDVVSSVKSIVFLATPHGGSDLSRTLADLLSVTGRPKYTNVAHLKDQSISQINEEFRHVSGGHMSDLKLASFYETRATSLGVQKTLIVRKDAAVLNQPGEVVAPMDADHRNICKFDSRDDPNYRTLQKLLAVCGV